MAKKEFLKVLEKLSFGEFNSFETALNNAFNSSVNSIKVIDEYPITKYQAKIIERILRALEKVEK